MVLKAGFPVSGLAATTSGGYITDPSQFAAAGQLTTSPTLIHTDPSLAAASALYQGLTISLRSLNFLNIFHVLNTIYLNRIALWNDQKKR